MKRTLNIFFFTFLVFLIIFSCKDSKREEIINQREVDLTLREKKFLEKETLFDSLKQFRDSVLTLRDSLRVKENQTWPDSIKGKWNSKIVCVESNCSDYAIGDQRFDIWDFVVDSTSGLIVNALTNSKENKIVRTYTGTYDPTNIFMNFRTDSLSKRDVTMQVVLKPIDLNKMNGSRTISIDDKCSATFTVELTKLKNQTSPN